MKLWDLDLHPLKNQRANLIGHVGCGHISSYSKKKIKGERYDQRLCVSVSHF